MKSIWHCALALKLLFFTSICLAKSYNLEIKKDENGKITVNDQFPALQLHFFEGEEVKITVKNKMQEPTSIHWHGILLDGTMDGVPGLNGFKGIAPGEKFTYHYKLRQAGTYWYHSHSNLQEQQGLYGALIVHKKHDIKVDRDYVIMLSDFSEENPETIVNNLKIDSGYYNYNKRTVATFFKDVKKNGLMATLDDYLHWGQMRMDPTDLADVTNYKFLINGQEKSDFFFKKGEKIRLRFINAAAMTIFDVAIPGLELEFIEADGQPIKPVKADEFRIGVAETYDVIVRPKKNSYAIFAESLDRTGYAYANLMEKGAKPAKLPKMRPRALLTMADMGHNHGKSGWGDMATAKGKKALSYQDLVARNRQKNTQKPTREIEFVFGGMMNRYIWTINGEQFPKPFKIKYGERVRLKFSNATMMAHPIHLHGMFMQLENGRKAGDLPSKHTVLVPPGQSVTTLLTADEAGEWAFHCHLLYHMSNGMMTNINVVR